MSDELAGGSLTTLAWILGSALAMSAIAWVGLLTAALNEKQLNKVLLPLVAFAAGSLLGGVLLHLLPEAVAARGAGMGAFLPALGGFALFFLMEQFLSWHHGHSAQAEAKQPVTYLILLADGLHNFIGGLAIGASLIVSTEVGAITCSFRARPTTAGIASSAVARPGAPPACASRDLGDSFQGQCPHRCLGRR